MLLGLRKWGQRLGQPRPQRQPEDERHRGRERRKYVPVGETCEPCRSTQEQECLQHKVKATGGGGSTQGPWE